MAKTKLYTIYMGPYGARVEIGVSGSYMDAVFKLVAREESEIRTSLPHSFTKEGLLQPGPVPSPTPLDRSQQEIEQHFDILYALLGAGVPHIAEQIFSYLDSRTLTVSEQVCTLWRDVIADLLIWENQVKEKVKKEPLWKDLFKKRGWCKYLLNKQSSSQYRNLYRTACKDIHSLEANWRRGHYTSTKIKTDSAIECLQYDDSKIVTGHGIPDHTIQIRDKNTQQVLKVLKGHTNVVWCLQYNEEMIISGSRDHTVKVWDIKTGHMTNDLKQHKDAVLSLKFTSKTLVTGSHDGTVAVWNIESPRNITLRTVLKTLRYGVRAVDLNETYITAGSANTIKVWDISTGMLIRTLHGHSGIVRGMHLRGNRLISGSADKTVRIWNVDTGECLRVLHGHDGNVRCVAMDDKRILSGSDDKTVKVWDLAAALEPDTSSEALCMTTLKEHTDTVWELQFDSFQVISVSKDKRIIVYDFLPPSH